VDFISAMPFYLYFLKVLTVISTKKVLCIKLRSPSLPPFSVFLFIFFYFFLANSHIRSSFFRYIKKRTVADSMISGSEEKHQGMSAAEKNIVRKLDFIYVLPFVFFTSFLQVHNRNSLP
jgi:hypothetical protein